MAQKRSHYHLKNGFILEFWDHSKLMAGDRWQVVLEMRMAVPVTPELLPPDLQERREEVINLLGPEVVFSRQDVRHFIAVSDMGQCLADMESRLLSGSRAYLEHPDFAPRFLRRTFQDRLKKYP